jgi:hypothetical protein
LEKPDSNRNESVPTESIPEEALAVKNQKVFQVIHHSWYAASFYNELIRCGLPEDVARDLAIAYVSVIVMHNVIE